MFRAVIRTANMASRRKAGKNLPDMTVSRSMRTSLATEVRGKKDMYETSIAKGSESITSVPTESSTLSQRKRKRVDPKEQSIAETELPPEEEGKASPAEVEAALERPAPVNSDYIPLPWKGRLGYACLNTYLRYSNPTVFCSRTCRIASILEHQHALQDPSQPEHPTKNRPDKNKVPDPELGMKWVQSLALQNVRDIPKMIRWNDKYGIKFMRLSSEMFPFASHEVYGYKLSSFASEALADAGKVIAKLGHRVSVHPGQFTQLGSPRKEVIQNSVRDLEYHDEMLSLLKLPEQQDRDAVMILHMGGTYGSKSETLDRFRQNYTTLLSDSIKRRLVLENDDMSWSVHDLLPICQELNIPMVLDFHHHNIIFDSTQVREGTLDIMELFPVIRETWTRKGITQKMHYSEPVDGTVTNMARRKHSARVRTLPPCVPDMDLMIEAKDKEQAVFELMKRFKLPGYDKIGDLIAHERDDENIVKPVRKKKGEDEIEEAVVIPEDEVGMGGPENRVYWPIGHEDWLRPKKRERKIEPEGGESQALENAELADTLKKKTSNRPTKVKEVIKKVTKSVQKRTPKKRMSAVLTPSDTASDAASDEAEEPALKLPRRQSRRGGQVSYREDSSE